MEVAGAKASLSNTPFEQPIDHFQVTSGGTSFIALEDGAAGK
jgi:hypothetical protein